MIKPINFFLFALFLLLQYELWMAPNGVARAWHLQRQVVAKQLQVEKMAEKNALLTVDVKNLKRGGEAIEERARYALGMVKPDEVFYEVIEDD